MEPNLFEERQVIKSNKRKTTIRISCICLVNSTYFKIFTGKSRKALSLFCSLNTGLCSICSTINHVSTAILLIFKLANVFTSYNKPLNLCCTFINLQEKKYRLNIFSTQITSIYSIIWKVV